jgi:hypothetical protein
MTTEQLAQLIFDRTLPTKTTTGSPIRIPIENWRDETRNHFMLLARLEGARAAEQRNG